MAILNDFEAEIDPEPQQEEVRSKEVGGRGEEVGLALLMKEVRRRSISDSTLDKTARTEDWTRASSVPRAERTADSSPVATDRRRSSVGTEEPTWWTGGGLVVNGKKLGTAGTVDTVQENRYRNDDEPLVSRTSIGSRSEFEKSNSRTSGSSTPRRSIPEELTSTLRANYTNSIQAATRSPSLAILDPIVPSSKPSSRPSSQNASPSCSTFSPASTIMGHNEIRRSSYPSPAAASKYPEPPSISEPYSRRVSGNSLIGGDESPNRPIRPDGSSTGTLLFGNLAQPPFSFNSPNPTSPRSLPTVTHDPLESLRGPSLIQTSTVTQTRSPDSESSSVLSSSPNNNNNSTTPPNNIINSPLHSNQQTLTPGSSKSDKKPLPILRAKSSRRVSAGTLRRAAMDSHSTTIAEGRETTDGEIIEEGESKRRKDSVNTPQREDSRDLISEFSTPLSTSDFADAYFDQSPYRSDMETLYSNPIPSTSTSQPSTTTTTFRHPFRSSLELNYPGGYPSSAPSTSSRQFDRSSPNRRPSTDPNNNMYIDRRPSVDPLSTMGYEDDRRPSVMSSVFSEEDVFHDASGEEESSRLNWDTRPSISSLVDSNLLASNSIPIITTPNTTNTTKMDAKARAAAFVADLRRARSEATASAAASSTESNNGLESPVTSVFSAQAETPEPIFEEPSQQEGEEDNSNQSISSPNIIPSIPTRSNSSSNGIPSPTRSNTNSIELISPSPPQISIITPVNYPELDKLNRRRRPLPSSLQFTDVRKLKTPGQRAKMYAIKLNALAKEDSGVNTWVGFVRGEFNPKQSSQSFTSQTRTNRVESSSASSIFPLRSDSYQAKEIPYGHFGPSDLTPTVPYPGVLLPLNSRYSNSSLKASSLLGGVGKSSSSSSNSSTSNFFSTLGRKGSKRTLTSSNSQQSRNNTIGLGHAGSGGNGGGYIINSPLGPLGIKSNSNSNSLLGIRSSLNSNNNISGPRMPGSVGNHQQTLNTRTSFDSIASTATNATTSNYQSSNTYNTIRSSGGGGMIKEEEKEMLEEKLKKLKDILPHVEKEILFNYLIKSGGDDVTAISLYFEDEKDREMERRRRG